MITIYTVSTLMTAFNAASAALAACNFQNITITYSDIRNKYTLTTSANTTYSLAILAISIMTLC